MQVYVAVPSSPQGLEVHLVHFPLRVFTDRVKAVARVVKDMGGEELCCVAHGQDYDVVWAGCQHPGFFFTPEVKIYPIETEE